MLILLSNIATVVLLAIAAANLVEGLLRYHRAMTMMLAQYTVSSSVETNEFSRTQYDYLSRYIAAEIVAYRQINWSIVGVAVIICLRIAVGAI